MVISLGKAPSFSLFSNHTSQDGAMWHKRRSLSTTISLLHGGLYEKNVQSIRPSVKKTCLPHRSAGPPSRPADRPTQDWLCRQTAHIPVGFVARLFVLVSNAHFLLVHPSTWKKDSTWRNMSTAMWHLWLLYVTDWPDQLKSGFFPADAVKIKCRLPIILVRYLLMDSNWCFVVYPPGGAK